MPQFEFSTIDLIIVVVYAVVVIILGLRYAKKKESAEDYFLGGRRFTWTLVGLSLFASNMSSSSLIGLSGAAYGTGISVYNYEWMAAVVLIFFAIFFLPYYLKSQVFTMPEFLEKRFDARSRYYFSGLTLISTIIIDTAGSLYAGALVIQIIFPQVEIWQGAAFLAILAGSYTIVGGLAAVVFTDAIQAIMLTIGSIIVAVLAFIAIGGSWEAVTNATPPEMLGVIMPLNDSFLPWPGLLIGVPILGFYFWCTNQFMVQRVLGAKDVNHGRWGVLFAAAMKVPVIFFMVLPGAFARVLYPDLTNPDMVFPTLMFDLLPVGILGLIAAALLAAIMSSIDSTLNSASTLVTMDFFQKIKPDASQKTLTTVGRLFAFIFMILSAAWAPQIVNFPSLFSYLQNILAFISPPIVALFLTGLFWRRANGHGAFAAIMVGGIISVVGIVSTVTGADNILTQIHFLYMAGIILLLCTIIVIVVSLLTTPPDEEKVESFIWTKKVYDAETEELKLMPWYQNYRILSLIILASVAVMVGMFW
jgi:SSS family solute:Na+ symporter